MRWMLLLPAWPRPMCPYPTATPSTRRLFPMNSRSAQQSRGSWREDIMIDYQWLAIAPSTARVGQTVPVAVQQVDRFHRLLQGIASPIEIRQRPAGEDSVSAFAPARHIRGQGLITTSFGRPGTYRVEVRDASSGETRLSNPVVVGAETCLYWGDIHG